MSKPAWSPPVEIHDAVKGWMAEQGWPVTTEHFYFESEAYAWRHDGEGSSPTLVIAQDVLEDYESKPADLIALLNLKNFAREIQRAPKELIVRRNERGLVLENFTHRR